VTALRKGGLGTWKSDPGSPALEPIGDSSAGNSPIHDSGEPPAWIRAAALLGAAAVLGFGTTGLVLAINGMHRPALALPLGVAATAGVAFLGWRAVASPGGTNREAHFAAAIGIACIVAITVWNTANASEHVLIDRDGGAYVNTGRWIAREGSLEVEPNVGAFEDEQTVAFLSWAMHPSGDQLQFQFAHLLPVLLADAHYVGGDGALTRAPPLFSGLAFLAFFVLAWRLLRRPWFALAATLTLAFLVPQVWFSRDAYSEIPSQILLFTALWLIADRRIFPDTRTALTSGLFLGALWAVRIDALVFLIGLPVLLAIAWLRVDVKTRTERIRPALVCFALGLVPGMLLGFVDLRFHSRQYWSDLAGEQQRLVFVFALSAIASVVVAFAWRFVGPKLRRLPWNGIAWAVAICIMVGGFATWAFRPRIQVGRADAAPIDAFQRAEGVAVDVTRAYHERSLTWMGWYLGGLTVAAAIIGAALLVRWILLGKRVQWIAPLCVLGPGTALYLYKASAIPDHPWVMRRFLVSAFPTFILLAFGLAVFLFSRRQAWARVLAVVLAGFAVLYPLGTLLPVRSMTEMRGFASVIDDACDAVGPDAAVIVIESDSHDLLENWVPQAFRGWCGSTVAVSSWDGSTPESLHRLAREWEQEGKPLFLVARTPEAITRLLPDAEVTTTRTATNTHKLSRRLTYRPRDYMSDSLTMAIGRIPAN
jgi:hypothetical protein